jgi:formylglycine-generating enzyme required for sulfatase activity
MRDKPIIEFVPIPAGEFWMGSDANEIDSCIRFWADQLVEPDFKPDQFRSWVLKEYPKHLIHVKEFSIGRFPVTNREYRIFVQKRRWVVPESLSLLGCDDHPVWGVSFEDALAYCEFLGHQLDFSCRLPTEAEWEYAARGRSCNEYPFGSKFEPTYCNTLEGGVGHTTSVNRYPQGASEFGVYDMAGNVEEWTSDFYEPYPGGITIVDDLAASLGKYRVLRGGSFARGGDLARCARRHGPHPGLAYRYRGFRVATECNNSNFS